MTDKPRMKTPLYFLGTTHLEVDIGKSAIWFFIISLKQARNNISRRPDKE